MNEQPNTLSDCVMCLFSQHTSVDDGRGQVSSRCGRSKNAPSATDETPHIGNYRLLKTIGKGNFAKVKLARHVRTGHEVRRAAGQRDLVKSKCFYSVCQIFLILLQEDVKY